MEAMMTREDLMKIKTMIKQTKTILKIDFVKVEIPVPTCTAVLLLFTSTAWWSGITFKSGRSPREEKTGKHIRKTFSQMHFTNLERTGTDSQ